MIIFWLWLITFCDWYSLSLQDVSDFEWVMWFTTFRNHILFALSGHVIFAKICSMLSPKVLYGVIHLMHIDRVIYNILIL